MIMNIYSNCDKLLNCQQGLMMNDKILIIYEMLFNIDPK